MATSSAPLGWPSTAAARPCSRSGSARRGARRSGPPRDRSRAGFDGALAGYEAGWAAYDATLTRPRTEKLPGVTATQRKQLDAAYFLSANVLKASEDKTFPGAIVASLASPWGQAISAGDPANTYFGSYREVFSRDLYEAWTGLLADGDLATARDATLFLFERQQLPDGSLPRNSLVNGKTAPDSFGTQLDEVAYPILMADQLGLTDATLYSATHQARRELPRRARPGVRVRALGGAERLLAVDHRGRDRGPRRRGRPCQVERRSGVGRHLARRGRRHATIDQAWTVTTNGPLSANPYFIRLSKGGDPNAAIVYNVGNGGPELDQRAVIDAGFLELVRLGELPPADPDVARSLAIVDATIKTTTASGPGWHRYNGDGYGDNASDGRPWAPSGKGTGHLWPVLSAERAEQSLATGDAAGATSLLLGMRQFASGVGLVPEQDWELPDRSLPRPTAPTRRSPRSASPTAMPPARRRRSPGRPRRSYG